jgi:hypothetical protein
VPTLDASSWPAHSSACYGYRILLPPEWEVAEPFAHTGYQQGESATYRAPGRKARLSISSFYTPADSYELSSEALILGPSEYLISGPTPIDVDGVPGLQTYVRVSEPPLAGVRITWRFSPRQDWYVVVAADLLAPYDELPARAIRTVAESLLFE